MTEPKFLEGKQSPIPAASLRQRNLAHAPCSLVLGALVHPQPLFSRASRALDSPNSSTQNTTCQQVHEMLKS